MAHDSADDPGPDEHDAAGRSKIALPAAGALYVGAAGWLLFAPEPESTCGTPLTGQTEIAGIIGALSLLVIMLKIFTEPRGAGKATRSVMIKVGVSIVLLGLLLVVFVQGRYHLCLQ